MATRTHFNDTANYLFVFAVSALVLFGLAMLSTASALMSYNHFQDNYYYLKRQLVNGVIPGIILFIIASRFSYLKLKRFALPLFLVSLFLLALVFAPVVGVSLKGAARWIHFGSFTFQPSEILKLSFVIYLAVFFESRKQHIAQVAEGFVPFLGLSALAGILLVIEPDLGTLGVILSTALGVYFVAGAKVSHMLGAVLLGLVALVLFVAIFGHAGDRIKTFFDPQQDPLRASYQINQALTSIKSGGVLGLGFGEAQGRLGSTLPEPMGDSIFAIIAQELGLAGVLFILGLFLFLAWCGLRVAKAAPDVFGSLLASGIMIWILVQAFINMSAISGILPLTGIPLPFISYGGTSLVVLLTACGIVYNIQKSAS